MITQFELLPLYSLFRFHAPHAKYISLEKCNHCLAFIFKKVAEEMFICNTCFRINDLKLIILTRPIIPSNHLFPVSIVKTISI